MYRIALLATGLLTASVGYTQTIGPPIAYVKGSAKGDAIYLINPDGTGETKVYQAPRNGRLGGGQIGRVSVMPGGGALAFTLNFSQLMVQNFDSAGQPVGSAYEVDVPGNCGVDEGDYRSDGVLHVHDTCMNDWTVAPGGTVASAAFTGGNWGALAALGTSLLYVEHGSTTTNNGEITGDLKVRTTGGTVSQITQLTYTLPLYVDAVGNTAVVSQAGSFRTVDLTTGAISTGCTTGGMVKYSPTGTQMVYEYRNMLFVHNSDCSGAPFRLARGAKAVAWRSD